MRLADIMAFLEGDQPVVEVEITGVRGSSPREEGAVMFVSAASMAGTIGGGQLEYMALDEARKILKSGAGQVMMDVPLGPEIGQCCGGRVEVTLKLMGADTRAAAVARAAAEVAARPHVYLFGAGHVGRALAEVLQHMPVVCHLVDSRQEELDLCAADVTKTLTALPEAEVRGAPESSAFVVLTHDHALDFLVASEALARGDAAYVGMIGSATKRAKFVSFAREQGVNHSALVCPMGAAVGADKRPQVIAAGVLAEVMAQVTQPVPASELSE